MVFITFLYNILSTYLTYAALLASLVGITINKSERLWPQSQAHLLADNRSNLFMVFGSNGHCHAVAIKHKRAIAIAKQAFKDQHNEVGGSSKEAAD